MKVVKLLNKNRV